MANNRPRYIGIAIFIVLLVIVRIFFTGKSKSSFQDGHYHHSRPPASSESAKNNVDGEINRNASQIIYSRHAKCRMDCRHIDAAEIREILAHGTVNQRKIEKDDRGTTYPLEGTVNKHHLRVVFAPKGQDAVEVVTCIDLDTEWQCDCH